MAEPQDTIVPFLHEMRAEMQAGFSEISRKFDAVGARFDRLEARFDNLSQAVDGESVLGRYAAAKVEDRLEAIEKRLTSLESRT